MSHDPGVFLGDFYLKCEVIKNSRLYQALSQMPKPAVHHLHLTAACPLDFLVKLTRYDYVYYNERTGLFKVSKKGIPSEGYILVNNLRKHWSSSKEFDDFIKNKILLNRD